MTDHDFPTDDAPEEFDAPEVEDPGSPSSGDPEPPDELDLADDFESSSDDALLDEPEESAAESTKTVYKGSGVRWGFVAGLILAVLLVILVFQNTDPVQFRFLIWEIETPLAALLIATAVIAAVADELVGLVVRARRRRRLEEKEELKQLRERSGS